MLADELDHLAIAVGSLAVFATGLVHHAESIIAVVHLGEQHQGIARGLIGLVALAGTDEVGGGVGRDGQLVIISVLGAEESRRDGGFHLTKVLGMRGGAFSALGISLGKLLAVERFLLAKGSSPDRVGDDFSEFGRDGGV